MLVTTGVYQSQSSAENGYKLYNNFPNPFNPQTSISYYLPSGENVKLKVFDILGNEITTLVNEFKSSGIHSVIFDAKDIPSGVYFYGIQAGKYSDRKKMMVIK